MTDDEKMELTQSAAQVGIAQLGEEEFFRRVNVAGRLIYETLVSHFGDDPLGAVVGLTALNYLAESGLQQIKEMALAVKADPREWEN